MILVHIAAFWSGAVGSSLPYWYIFRITAALWVPPTDHGSLFLAQGQDSTAPLIPAKPHHSLGRAAWDSDKRVVVTCCWLWSVLQQEGTTALPKPVNGDILALWEAECPTEFFQMEPIRSPVSWAPAWLWNSHFHWACAVFLLQPLHLLLVAVWYSLLREEFLCSHPWI